MNSFSVLGLAEQVVRALSKEDYTVPTPIQAQSIPILLKGHDLLGIAQTGTGKTAAFATPLLTRMVQNPRPATPRNVRVLVLAPTRELAAQIADSFKTYGQFVGISVATIVGGVSYGPQVKALHRGLDVLVATPGRLLDHLQEGNVRLDKVEAVVLDEADHMFDLGFIVPIRKILAKLPKTRQSLFFSATMPREIASLAGEFLHKPERVEVAPAATTTERVRQEVIMVGPGGKGPALLNLVKKPEFERTIVFTRTKRGADKVCKALDRTGIVALAIHGNKSQNQRQAALDAFKSGKASVLVATDIAARGIDVPMVSHVINFELPDVPESYVHRIGRTARAGAEGIAISLVDASERHLLRAIEKLVRQPIEVTARLAGASADSDEAFIEAPKPRGRSNSGRNNSGRSDNPRQQNGKPNAGGRNASARPEGARSRRKPFTGTPAHAGPQWAAEPPHAADASGERPITTRKPQRPGSRARERHRQSQQPQG